MTRRVENSDAHQMLVAEALEAAIKENVVLKDRVRELDSRVSGLIEELEMTRKEAESVSSGAKKHYTSNFHLTQAYQGFAKYW